MCSKVERDIVLCQKSNYHIEADPELEHYVEADPEFEMADSLNNVYGNADDAKESSADSEVPLTFKVARQFPIVPTFPEMLMGVLNNSKNDSSIAWEPSGNSFSVKNPSVFIEKILPQFMRQCKYSSFVRKLYRWGFKQFNSETKRNCFYNELFKRNDKHKCKSMRCNSVNKRKKLECIKNLKLKKEAELKNGSAFDHGIEILSDSSINPSITLQRASDFQINGQSYPNGLGNITNSSNPSFPFSPNESSPSLLQQNDIIMATKILELELETKILNRLPVAPINNEMIGFNRTNQIMNNDHCHMSPSAFQVEGNNFGSTADGYSLTKMDMIKSLSDYDQKIQYNCEVIKLITNQLEIVYR